MSMGEGGYRWSLNMLIYGFAHNFAVSLIYVMGGWVTSLGICPKYHRLTAS